MSGKETELSKYRDKRTSRELKLLWQGYNVTIPKHSRCYYIHGGTGGWAVAHAIHVCITDCPDLFRHDATYRYVWVPESCLEDY